MSGPSAKPQKDMTQRREKISQYVITAFIVATLPLALASGITRGICRLLALAMYKSGVRVRKFNRTNALLADIHEKISFTQN